MSEQNDPKNTAKKPYLQRFHALFAVKTSLFWSVKKASLENKQAFFA